MVSSAAARLWARTDVRRRWRSLVGLAVLAGVTAGLAMAAFAGARRTDTALTRLRAVTDASDAIVFASQVGASHPDWTALAARPEVADLAVWALLFGEIPGEPGEAVLFGAVDHHYLATVDRPVVVAGRMFDPDASDEVVVDENLAREAPIGTTFAFRAYANGQNDETGEPPAGPTIPLRVVGVVRDVPQFLFVTDGQVLVPPGVLARYGPQIATFQNASVRLVHGGADVPALQRDANTAVAPGVPVLDVDQVSRRVDTTLDVEHAALVLLGLVVAIAGALLVGQAVARSAAGIGDDAPVLGALGMTRRDIVTASALDHALTAVLAALVAFGAAVALSRWFPVGLGRRVDPDVGVHVDWTVLLPGALIAGAFVLVVVTTVAALVARRQRRPSGASRPGWAAAIGRRAPLTLGLSASMAFGRSPGQSRQPARSAVLAAVVAVAGIVGALTIEQGVNDSLADPARAGVVWDAIVTPTTADLTPQGVNTDLAQRVAAAAGPGAAVAVETRDVVPVNDVGVAAFSTRPLPGEAAAPISLRLVSGRAPGGMGEAAIGPATARELAVHVGDVVRVGASGAPIRIVGEALFPNDVHSEFDEGIWLSPAQYDAAIPPAEAIQTGVDHALVIRFPRGQDAAAGLARVGSAVGNRADVEPADVPDELTNLRNVRSLPLLVAGFLAVLAAGALAYVLLGSARRRRRDFAILRACGFTRRQCRLVLYAIGTTIALVGVVVGVPLGIAAGRAGWRLVTERVPLADVAPFALLAVILVVPGAILAANALAVWPGGVVARRRMPAEVLRTE